MKINRGAIVFGVVITVLLILIGGGVWIFSIVNTPTGNTPSDGRSLFSALFPFGQGAIPPSSTSGTGSADNGQSGPAPTLREVSHAPIAGAHFQSDGTLRYIETETGHVFDTKPEDLNVVRVSNTTIPGIKKTAWLGDGVFVLQYLDEKKGIRNYLATLASSTADQAIVGHFLANFTDVLSSFDEKHMTVGVRTSAGLSVLVSDTDEKVKKTVFVSPVRSWSVITSGKNIYIETAPSSEPGYAYRLDTTTLALTKITGGVQGLMISPDVSSNLIAYSSYAQSGASLFVLDTEKNKLLSSPIGTLAEKCVWLPGPTKKIFCGVPAKTAGVSLDAWFMGTASFSDSAWVIDPERGTAQVIRDLEKDAGRPIDIVNPVVSPDGSYVAFTNKTDLSLWSLLIAK